MIDVRARVRRDDPEWPLVRSAASATAREALAACDGTPDGLQQAERAFQVRWSDAPRFTGIFANERQFYLRRVAERGARRSSAAPTSDD
ncbi:hypothetical protein [Geodermatophilus sp. URMC 64]